MHSWIFRNRERLRLVYGAVAPVPEEACDTAESKESGLEQPAEPPLVPHQGTVEHCLGDVLLVPMPRSCA